MSTERDERAELSGDTPAHYEAVAYADDIPEGQDWEVPEDYERHYSAEDGEDWPCSTFAQAEKSQALAASSETTKEGPSSAMAERGRRGGESSDRVVSLGDGGR